MIGLLQSIVDLLVCWIETAAVTVLNLLVLAVGSLIALLIAADPVNMPDPPTLPAAMVTAEGWVAWVFPVHQAVLVFAFVLSAWIAWQVIAIAMRWGKAL